MECIQLSLSGKMFPELSAQTAEKISEPCWKNLPTRHNQTFQFLDLRGGRWCKAGAIIGNGWSLAWRLLNAERWGVPQRRKRIAVVADFRGQCAAEILFERTGLSGNPDKSIPTWQSVTGFTQNCPAGHDRVVEGEAAYTLKIRSGCAGGGKGALVQTEKTGTLSTLQDQTLFQPIVFDARGNGNGKTVPTITGDHESRVTDYTAIAVDLYNGAVTGSKAAALSCKNTGTTAGPQVAERKPIASRLSLHTRKATAVQH